MSTVPVEEGKKGKGRPAYEGNPTATLIAILSEEVGVAVRLHAWIPKTGMVTHFSGCVSPDDRRARPPWSLATFKDVLERETCGEAAGAVA